MSESEIESAASAVDAIAIPTTVNTVVPRYIAAALDNCVAMLLAVIAAKSISSNYAIVQALALVAAYLGYYWAFEAIFSRTPGKFLTGLIVVDFYGEKCSPYQTTIRTFFRLLEVNPLLLGALPAGLSVVFSRHHQRFGDKVAKTLVVDSRSL
jgi:uncharacterized RDD family membrane protein YckC